VNTVHDKRCLNHRNREAVARCPSCRDFYCRECVTEHLGRVICAKCLAAITAESRDARKHFSVVRPLVATLAFLLIWGYFFAMGRALLLLPDSFHDGSVWSAGGLDVYEEDEP